MARPPAGPSHRRGHHGGAVKSNYALVLLRWLPCDGDSRKPVETGSTELRKEATLTGPARAGLEARLRRGRPLKRPASRVTSRVVQTDSSVVVLVPQRRLVPLNGRAIPGIVAIRPMKAAVCHERPAGRLNPGQGREGIRRNSLCCSMLRSPAQPCGAVVLVCVFYSSSSITMGIPTVSA